MPPIDPRLIAPQSQPQTLAGPAQGPVIMPVNTAITPAAIHTQNEDTRADQLQPSKVEQSEADAEYKKYQILKLKNDLGLNPDGTPKNAFKVGDPEDIAHAWQMIDTINRAKNDAQKPLATGSVSSEIANIPVVHGLMGQSRANLQTDLQSISGDLRQIGIKNLYEMTGKKGVGTIARSNAEQTALQSSLAPLGYVSGPDGKLSPAASQPDTQHLLAGLDNAQSLYLQHLARLYGKDPSDPAVIASLTAAAGNPKLRSMEGVNTAAAPPPVVLNDNSPGEVGLSSKTKTVENPQLKAFAPTLGKMIASGQPDAVIAAAMKAHGAPDTNINQILQYRNSREFQIWKGQNPNRPYPISPNFYTKTVPNETGIPGLVDKAAEGALGTTGGHEAETGIAAAGDTGTLGLVSLIAGPETARKLALLSQQNPKSALLGNLVGGIPLGLTLPEARTVRGMGLQNAGVSAVHGFNASTEGDVGDRALNAATEGLTGGITGGTVGGIFRGTEHAYGGFDPDAAALSRFSRGAGPQSVGTYDRVLSLDPNSPALAGLSPRGLAFLQRLTSRNPQAQNIVEGASTAYTKGVPENLGQDIHSVISESEPTAADFLNRPAIDVRNDIQNMANREYSKGIEPIANEPVTVTPELAQTLDKEPVRRAVGEALGGGAPLSDNSRTLLRNLFPKLNSIFTAGGQKINVGGKTMTADEVRQAFGANADKILEDAGVSDNPKDIPLSVDALKTIATTLDRRAMNLNPGTEGRMALRDISNDLRGHITNQYPELSVVNDRYAGRMRQNDAMLDTRDAFLSNNNDHMDQFHLKAPNYSKEPGPIEFGTTGTTITPSERAMAMAGAREAVERSAGANAEGAARTTAKNVAAGPNQAIRNRELFSSPQAEGIEQSAAQKAATIDAFRGITAMPDIPARGGIFRTLGHLATGAKGWLISDLARGDININPEDATRVAHLMTDLKSGRATISGLENAATRQRRAAMAERILAIQLANTAASQRKDGGQ